MIRLDFIGAIKNDFARIRELDGFNYTMAKVHDGTPPNLPDVVDFPSVAMGSFGEKIFLGSEKGPKKHTAQFGIFGYYRVAQGQNDQLLAELFYEDVIRLLSGECAIDLLPLESVELLSFEPYPATDGKGFVLITLSITYYQ